MNVVEIQLSDLITVCGGQECGAELADLVKAREDHLPALRAWAADPRNPELAANEKRLSDGAGAAWRKANACLNPKPQ